jgi:hypothetical protein
VAFGDDVAQRTWQTGSVLPADLLLQLAPHLTRPGQAPTPVGADHWLVVISQTCDILATRLDAEPYVEVLHCKPVAGKPRKGRRDLQSTRHLDFRPNRETHAELVLGAHAIADRYIIPRELLAAHDPDPSRRLSDVASHRVLAWYALRAARPSWPNAFVDRISGAKDALENALEPLVEQVAEVRVAIAESDVELETDQSYHVAVYFVVDETTWNTDPNGRAAIYAAFGRFVGELAACDGIEVDQDLSQVISGGEFRWQAAQATDEWNFANLSHREA